MNKKPNNSISDIIHKTYVINLKHRTDRWESINKNFIETNLKLNRWDAIYGKDLPDKEIENITTDFCNNFCSNSIIGCWLSHYTLWQNIVKNKETNVLILEDDAYPVPNFDKLLKLYWKQIPKNWDMIYLGCMGSCDDSAFLKWFFIFYSQSENKKISPNVYIPGFPIGTHAYMLSYNGAKKLIENKYLKQVNYHIDKEVAKYALSDPNFKAYALNPNLVYQHFSSNYSDNQNTYHPIVTYLSSKIKISNHNLDSELSTILFHIRKLNVTVTVFVAILALVLFCIGLFASNIIRNYLIIILLLFYAWEIILGNDDVNRIYNLIVEFIILIIIVFLAFKIKKNINL